MIPLIEIGYNRRSHSPARQWLKLLFRQPADFELAINGLKSGLRPSVAFALLFHATPYVFAIVLAAVILFQMLTGNAGVVELILYPFASLFVMGWATLILHVPFKGFSIFTTSAIGFTIIGISGAVLLMFSNGIESHGAYEIASAAVLGLAFGLATKVALARPLGLLRGILLAAIPATIAGIAFSPQFGCAFAVTAAAALLSFQPPTRTASIEIDPPSCPSTGKSSLSPDTPDPSTYSSGR